MIRSPLINIGIDPGGTSGCICIINDASDFSRYEFHEFKKITDRDIANIAKTYSSYSKLLGVRCCLEKVHAMPKQGVSSIFSFGQNFGKCQLFTEILKAETHIWTPKKWQKAVGLVSIKGEEKTQHKKRLRQIAERLYPNVKIRNNNQVDALLLAHVSKNII